MRDDRSSTICERCGGSGQYKLKRCTKCNGQGWYTQFAERQSPAVQQAVTDIEEYFDGGE